jgi:hypothetical protein
MSTKDTLARILARENIVIKHSPEGEASFNPKKRILTLPIYDKNIDENTYDLMIGTGAGQALYGPSSKEIFENALPKISKDLKHAKKVLTIMDGIRTEKLVRGRYAGLSRIFSEAYAEIISNLKLQNINYKDLNILERLNLAFKMGTKADIPFTNEERKLVDLTAKMSTFQDAVNASRELLKFVEPDPPSPFPPQPCDDPDESEESEESKESSDDGKGSPKDNKDEQDDKQDDKDDKSDKKDDKKQDNKKDDKKDQKDQKDSKDKDKKDKSNSGKDDKQEKQDKEEKKDDSDKQDQGKGKQDQKDDKKDDKQDEKDQGSGKDKKEEEDKEKSNQDGSQGQKPDKQDQEDEESGQDESEGQDQEEDQGEGEENEDESPSSGGADDPKPNDEGGEEETEAQSQTMSPAQGNAKLDGPEISEMIASHMQDLIDDKAVAPVVGYMPDKLDPDAYIVPYKQFFHICRGSYGDGDTVNARKWMKENDTTVSFMVSEFERKKRAALYVRRKTAKTGVIDTNKLVHAMYSDDIFKRNMTVPEGKNHGMTFFLDWSGSMDPITPGTIDQLLNLILFCRRARIAHEGYLFSDRLSPELKKIKTKVVNKFGPGELMPVDNLSLIQVFTDQMTAAEFQQAVTYLYDIKQSFLPGVKRNQYTDEPVNLPVPLRQSSTPLDSSLLVSAYINDRLRERCKLEVVKTCVITDGASNAGLYMMRDNMTRDILNAAETVQDRRTGTILSANGTISATGMMAELASKRSNTEFYGFYLIEAGSSAMIPDLIRRYGFTVEGKNVNVSEFQKKKFLVVKNFGFKEYYIINPIQVVQKSVNAQNSLTQVLNSRSQDRVMLGRFIEQIAQTND